MKNHINKIAALSALGLAVLGMSGCLGTTHLSDGITDQGQVQMQDIIFPDMAKAWQHQGQFPNRENLSKMRPGVDKDDIYQLLGRPHFSEGQYAREWDYIMKFYMPDNSVKICQYKVIFDKQFKAQEFYWSPADCPPPVAEPQVVTQTIIQQMPAPVVVPVPTPVPAPIKERINLGADALFRFDKSDTQDMLDQGRRELDELASKLRQYQDMGDSRIIVTGHTDRKGDDAYNMNLSIKRAQTVRSYLINQGVNANTIIATGAGETQPVQQCATTLPRQQEIDCLQPNRRVTLDVTVIQ